MEDLIKLLPTLLTCLFCAFSLLIVSGHKYSKRRTTLVIIPSTLIIMGLNAWLFLPYGTNAFEEAFVITVFIPLAIINSFLGKRKGVSLVTGIMNAYLGFYLMFLIKGVFSTWTHNALWFEFFIYFVCFPLIILYLHLFYNRLHNLVENLLPKYLWMLLIYALTMFIEIWLYQFLINSTSLKVLRLEIFGVAILSVYFVSIIGFYIFLRQYRKKTYELREKSLLEKQVESIIVGYEARDMKEKELRILRHDMKHILITTSSLIQKKEYEKALDFIKSYVETIESTTTNRFCKDPIIDAVLDYYKKKCKEYNIKFKTKINNFEEVLKIPSYEMAILISNCLENAINASLKLQSNRTIEFIFLNNNGRLVLQIKNQFDGNIEFDHENKPTNPNENHGIGTKSINEFAKRNGLLLDYNITKTTFEVGILFKE